MTATLLAVGSASAALEVEFGTEYLGDNPDGTHNWVTTVTNLSQHISFDYNIDEVCIYTRTADNNIGTSRGWDLWGNENAHFNSGDNNFIVGTYDPLKYILPQLAYGPPFKKYMMIEYTTPTNWNRLGWGTITVDSFGAGQLDMEGWLPVPPGTNFAPAAWLTTHGFGIRYPDDDLLDADFDGHANWQEYIADTDPTNGLSVLTLAATPSNLVFQTSENCAYAVEQSSNLSSNHWNTVTNNLPGTGSITALPLGTNAPAFYRLKAVRIR
ncbi:hypothetical protein P4B35_00575 [Pontiellaceae bacterium B12227]|nr:hypothetical protein [Pontiellaceae bacterium B12227]